MSPSRPIPQPSAPQGSDTLLDVLHEAADAGFDAQFIALDGGLIGCADCATPVPPEEFEICSYRRLEGASDPADMLIVVWARCRSCGRRGTLVLGYGPNAAEPDVSVAGRLDLQAVDPSPGRERLSSPESPG